MTSRRKLVEGLTPADPKQQEREKEFVYGPDDESAGTPPAVENADAAPTQEISSLVSQQPQGVLPQYAGRVPITTRTRPEIASAVKRAALTRQLDGVSPFTVQDIVEEALELWLLTNGYIQR